MKLLILILLPFISLAVEKDFQIMKIYKKGQFREVKIYKGKNNSLMNKECLSSKVCQNAKTTPKKGTGLTGHPGSKACKEFRNSQYKILKDKDNNQYGFCLFSDGSLKSAWSLIHD
ncbi:DUF333 domain-containing protein [Halobacteriovorax sp. XZX-3]|uniref:DUF333 domain-containing protein n=1 Tax=unclassified Halobacteriovorax TaxID=2639665 RepID=UPI0011AF3192|nr:DUF333 domain-containing protein [Halobacteriovorax sp. DA5]